MNRTEERLADALSAAADVMSRRTLHPLVVPERRRSHRAWAVPLMAAVAVTLVVGLTEVTARWLPGGGNGTGAGAPAAPHRYYIEADLDQHRPVVRSTATGKVIATVPVPVSPNAAGYAVIGSAANGTFFAAAYVPSGKGERLYRFRLTASGHVSGFAAVPGGVLGRAQWVADALAASPDGKLVAVSFGSLDSCEAGHRCPSLGTQSDYIVVVNTTTGAQSVWRGGLDRLGPYVSVGNLSWAGGGRELVFLAQGCDAHVEPGSESCGPGPRVGNREVRTLDPATGGGRLDSGHLLLRQSARFPFIAQALISPDGSTITAMVLSGRVIGTQGVGGNAPDIMTVEQISVATGRGLGVLYHRRLGPTSIVNGVPDFLALIPDGTGSHWILNGGICVGNCTSGFNGWIGHGRLVPLRPADGRLAAEAWGAP
jgi:hypothetical protein